MALRLIIDPPQAGAWNMSCDEALLEGMAAQRQPTLRVYYWEQPTLSLGYFQAAKQRLEHPASSACPWVRRSTGGGAIVHDQEWTYSFCWPAPPRGPLDHFYHFFHQSVARCLSHWGIAACRCDQAQQQAPEPFLCFQRRARGDLLIGDHKIGGSAQRRRRGAALQHGSVLWQRSAAAPELPGIADLIARTPRMSEFVEAWLETLLEMQDTWPLPEAPLPSRWNAETWSNEERRSAEEIQGRRYETVDWNHRR